MPRPDVNKTLLTKLYHKKLLSEREIALLLKCNITTVRKKMGKFSIPKRNRVEAVRIAMKKQTISIPKYKLLPYVKKKLSISGIAKQLNFDHSIIKRELQRHSIPLHTPSEVAKLRGRKKMIKKSLITRLYFGEKLTQKQIGQKLHRDRATILQLMKRYGLKTRKRYRNHSRYPKSDFPGNPKEKSYLIGFRLGDLHVGSPSSYRVIIVQCTSTKRAQIDLFCHLFKKYGPIWISKRRKDGNKVMVAYLNKTFNFLLLKRDNIPKWIRENSQYFLCFLAGYADAEGHIGVYNNIARFTLASYDKKILRQVHEQLLKLGIPCNPPRISVKKGHVKSDGGVYRNNHWNFTISKKQSLLSLLKLLKTRLRHAKRLQNLGEANQNIITRNQRFPLKDFRKKLPV